MGLGEGLKRHYEGMGKIEDFDVGLVANGKSQTCRFTLGVNRCCCHVKLCDKKFVENKNLGI